ncbi:MAG TPA: ATP-grasp domain-containing protein [Candidatus Binatia bacterium]|nr:ATP-grasp domain-containing protein [Candidatus Binatia bacterium]
MRKVLVLGGDERSFLAVVRSLGRRGIAVHVGWCPPDALARRSRYVTRAHDLPPWRPGDAAWRDALVALLRAERFDLVVPTSDPTLIPLQRARAVLEPLARCYVLGERAFEVAFDKGKSRALAASLGIPVPREEAFATPVDPGAVLARFRPPVVLKPRASFAGDDLARKRFVHVARDPAALARCLRAFADQPDVLVQEHVAGVGAGVELLAHEGRVLAAFQHLRVHEPRTGGGSSYRTSVALDPALRDAAAKLMAALDYTGVAMVEFRGEPVRGTWTFLEINGRFWGSLPLAVAAGADFPYWLYQLLVEGRRDFPPTYRTGLYCRNWTRDLRWLADNLRAPRGTRAPLVRVLAEGARVLVGRERSDTLVADDPRPGVAEAARLAARAVRALGARLAARGPLRRLAVARARRALGRARYVLFVCKGNICRSPFAAAWARTVLAPDVRVASAGYHPRAGRAAPREAVEAAREHGIELAAHRSTVVDAELLRAADAVFVFDDENARTLAARFAFVRPKLHRLAPGGIADPYGGTLDDFRAAYAAIRRALERLAP